VPDEASQLERLKTALTDRYAIKRELGRGGMATVYLAEDVKHHRQVAVKVLRPELAAVLGGERFLKEIDVTANLQHPNILALYDSGEADTFIYYVMPYVDGESLRDRLSREKQLSIDEAVKITTAVASALDYAHRQEVIHRDIKPENILLHDGHALVADFGIALAVSAAGGTRITETGLSLGTPQYMSPEQATADRTLDARSDVYSLACVTYEMLLGDPPHTGSTAQAVIAALVTEEPRRITERRQTVPPHIEAAVHRALSKLPADRFSDAAKFAEALTTPQVTPGVAPASARVTAVTASRRSSALAWVLVGLLFVAALWGWLRPSGRSATGPLATFLVELLASEQVAEAPGNMVAVSPDGATIVYVGVGPEGRQLYARPIGTLRALVVGGTEDAAYPFFSPDGRWVGFSAKGEMRKISLDGGPPITITAGTYRGASWQSDNTILFSPIGRAGLSRVSADGGTPEIVTRADTSLGETDHGMPFALPGGAAALFTVWNTRVQEQQISVVDLESGEVRYLLEGTNPHYVETGHLVYVASDRTLRAVRFDLDRLEVIGRSVPVLEGVSVGRIPDVNMPGSVAEFGLSGNGTLVYLFGNDTDRTLVLVDRRGGERPLVDERRGFDAPRFSPDGRSVAVRVNDQAGFNVWRYELNRGAATKLTFDGSSFYPQWTPDGRRIAFIRVTRGNANLVWKRADGGGVEAPIYEHEASQWDIAWAPDGRRLVFRQNDRDTGRDLWMLALDNGARAAPLVQTASEERSPSLSRDGRFLAYVSDESGRSEIYVQTFPDGESRWQVTTTGGTEPVWSWDDAELFYRSGDSIVAVGITTTPAFAVGRAEAVVRGPYVPNPMHTNYDVHPDGNRFVMVRSGEGETRMIVVLNWFEELKAKVGSQ
jgi:serine/threonine-protein kinase